MDQMQYLMASPATLTLLVANIIVSIAGFRNEKLVEATLFDITMIRRRGQIYRMATSGFIHGDPTHLFMNMLALFFLGPSLEVTVGTSSFVGIYVAALLGGSLWTYMEHFREGSYRALGASGAVSGVTLAAAVFFPLSTIYVFYALPMPFILFAVLYTGWSAWAAATRVRDGIGHAAHLGGGLTGVALVCIFYPQNVQQSWNQVVQAVLPP